MFKGSMTAIVTPFKNGEVDEEALRGLVEFQIENGTDGIIPCGTTGESATLSHDEHDNVIEIVIDAVKKRIPVIAGTGSNNTVEAIRLTRHAYEAGADGALLLSPYYNRPTQEGIYRHFKAVAEAVPIPVILYNVPSRTGSNVLPETVARLSEISNIVGIKEATGDLRQVSSVIRLCGEGFSVISGDDFTVLPIMAIGGKGVISVASNIVPGDMSRLVKAAAAGDLAVAREIHYRVWPVMEALFFETNPIPVKAALSMMGKIEYELRLPLCPLSDANYERVKKVIGACGLI
ncbi:MAG: 4-hydroxy-tetrahydrodipicolinate synthase [Syntrophales bacterium]|jgi:4-hydroxy-tetrahydrodipicolinate synthase|nr:4-hydroxy-tetrahydrodipicolinate synthase [Syntrophales bacterium]MCK9528075.1 4-hydroxy-tetrahydrodipicolinate synthase [Syntrophales bacterium]MDX9922329.1 4-hydroxy-tetrahydrodipicolinate synthase [Syntrophales bacterium]